MNDATALVLYRVAIIAAVSDTFTLSDTLLSFVLATTVGIGVGLVVGVVTRKEPVWWESAGSAEFGVAMVTPLLYS